MSSIDNSKRRNQQSDLTDIQADYMRKRKELIKENEDDLDDLKSYYNQKKSAVINENEAAINHIRRRPIEIEEEVLDKRKKISDNYTRRLQKMQSGFDEKLKDLSEKRQQEVAEAKSDSHDRIIQVRNSTEKALRSVRETSADEIAEIKDNYRKQINNATDYNERRLQTIREDNVRAVNSEVKRGRIAKEKLRDQNEKEYKAQYVRGEKLILNEKESLDKKVKRLDEDSKKAYQRKKSDWVTREHQLNKDFSEKIKSDDVRNDRVLQTQHKHFGELYKKNEEAQRESLHVQQELFDRQIMETKKDFIRETENYTNRETDPFYKVQDRGSILNEDSQFYTLKAYVPEHEKDVVKVFVEKDKAIVSGQRAFRDKIADEGKIVSSASFQSFREEFPLETPVVAEGMTRERQGDWIVVQIPKAISNRLNRKA